MNIKIYIKTYIQNHPKFINQFSSGCIVKFIPYTKLPDQIKDICFIPPIKKVSKLNGKYSWLDENEFFEEIRNCSEDYIKSITFLNEFFNVKTNIYSRAYRMIYSPKDPSIINSANLTILCNRIQKEIITIVTSKFNIIIK